VVVSDSRTRVDVAPSRWSPVACRLPAGTRCSRVGPVVWLSLVLGLRRGRRWHALVARRGAANVADRRPPV